MNQIYVVHEYGAPGHFRALRHLIDQKYGGSVRFVEFAIVRKLAKAAITLNFGLVLRVIGNLLTLTRLLCTRGAIVVVGIAPYDFRLIPMRFVLHGHKVFYFTSWPRWDGSFYPKKTFSRTRAVRRGWKAFLERDVVGCFAVTEAARRSLLENYDVVESCVVHHSIDRKMIQVPRPRDRRELRCAFVGRLIDEKGIDVVIELIERLPADAYRFSIVGGGRHGGRIARLGECRANVECWGYIEDKARLARIVRDCDVLLLPSKRSESWEELFGIVVIEAMASGVVPVCSDHTGPSEIISHGDDGFLVPEADAVEELRRILTELAADRSSLEKMRRSAHDRAHCFLEERIAQRWDSMLEKRLV